VKRKKKHVSSNRQWTPLAARSVSSNTEELIMENGETGLIKKIERGECLRLLIEIRVKNSLLTTSCAEIFRNWISVRLGRCLQEGECIANIDTYLFSVGWQISSLLRDS
jgi:hypothetical protein